MPKIQSISDKVKVTDSAGTSINPATEESLQGIEDAVHAEDAAHVTSDKGILLLGIRKDDVAALSSTDGDYTPLILNEDGILRTQAQQHKHIDECEAITGWTVLGNDTTSLATTTNHVFETVALEFDKVDSADNTVFAGIQKTITSIDVTAYHKGGGFILYSIYLSSLTDVDYVFIRLGTSSSNYNEWRIDVDDLVSGWNLCRFISGQPNTKLGNGWNSAAVTYITVGAAFNAESDTLADIAVDHISLNTGIMSTVPIETPKNINLLKIKNKVVDTQAGNTSTGTQRITIASDDINLLAIKTALEKIDDWDDSDKCKTYESFSGTPYSTPITSSNAVQRFNATNPKLLRDVVLRNTDTANAVDIGLYNATVATFRGASFELAAGATVGFTLVDLYQLGTVSSIDGSHAIIHVIGTLK